VSRAFILVLVALVACGKQTVQTRADALVSAPVPPPQTPLGVVGCGDFTLAIPNEERTQYVILEVDTRRVGNARENVDLASRSVGIVARLEAYARPVTGEIACTVRRSEWQWPEEYLAIEGRLSFELVDGKYASARIENARFRTEWRGGVLEVPSAVAANVRVGWEPR
jgi:hypothetical protein